MPPNQRLIVWHVLHLPCVWPSMTLMIWLPDKQGKLIKKESVVHHIPAMTLGDEPYVSKGEWLSLLPWLHPWLYHCDMLPCPYLDQHCTTCPSMPFLLCYLMELMLHVNKDNRFPCHPSGPSNQVFYQSTPT